MILNKDQLKQEGIAKGIGNPNDKMEEYIEKVLSGDGPCEKCNCHPYAVLAAAKVMHVTIYVYHFPVNDSHDMWHVCIYDPDPSDPLKSSRDFKIMWRVAEGYNIFCPMGTEDQMEPETEEKTESKAESNAESNAEPKAEPKAESKADTEIDLSKEIERIQLSTPKDAFEMQLKILKLQKLKRIQKKKH